VRPLLLLAVLTLATAGCLATPEAVEEPALATLPGAAAVEDLGEPFVLDWTGHILTGQFRGFAHGRITEDAMWPVQQEGFLLDLHEVPKAMEVSLDWEGEGEFLIMLHSHKAEGTNTYVEHITDMSAEKPKCLRVPTEDLTEGHWQVMVHTGQDTTNVDYTLTVTTWGVETSVVEDERHGHWPQDGGFEVDEHEILPCEGMPEAAA
jgi:hypothetical protein